MANQIEQFMTVYTLIVFICYVFMCACLMPEVLHNTHTGLEMELVRHPNSQVVFSPRQTSGTFWVRVYSTSSMEKFEFKRSDQEAHEQEILIEQGETVRLVTRCTELCVDS